MIEQNYAPRFIHRPMKAPIWVPSSREYEIVIDEAAEIHEVSPLDVIASLYDKLFENKQLNDIDQEKIRLSMEQLSKGNELKAIDLMLEHLISRSTTTELLTEVSSLVDTIYRVTATIADDVVTTNP